MTSAFGILGALAMLVLGMAKLLGAVLEVEWAIWGCFSSSIFASAASNKSKSGMAGTVGSPDVGVACDGCVKASNDDCASSFAFRFFRRTVGA